MGLPPHADVAPRGRPAPAHLPMAGVVLCGGRGTRMGREKASIEIGGVTLLQRALARLSRVCDPVLVASGDLVVDTGGHRSVADALPGSGPLGGVVGALREASHPLLAVVAVDLPWLDPGLLEMLAGRIGDADAALCETARGVEPLHAVYARTALSAAEAAVRGGDRSLRGLIATLRTVLVTEAEWSGAGFAGAFARNVNTPDDLEEVRRELHR